MAGCLLVCPLIRLSVCLSVHLAVCVSVCPPCCLCVCLFIWPSVCVPVCSLSKHLTGCLCLRIVYMHLSAVPVVCAFFVRLSTCSAACVSVCSPGSLFVWLRVCLCVCLHLISCSGVVLVYCCLFSPSLSLDARLSVRFPAFDLYYLIVVLNVY